MSEVLPEYNSGLEYDQEPIIDRPSVAIKLRELGVDVDFEDWDGLDDNEVLGMIAMFSSQYDVDMEELFEAVGIDIDNVGGKK